MMLSPTGEAVELSEFRISREGIYIKGHLAEKLCDYEQGERPSRLQTSGIFDNSPTPNSVLSIGGKRRTL